MQVIAFAFNLYMRDKIKTWARIQRLKSCEISCVLSKRVVYRYWQLVMFKRCLNKKMVWYCMNWSFVRPSVVAVHSIYSFYSSFSFDEKIGGATYSLRLYKLKLHFVFEITLLWHKPLFFQYHSSSNTLSNNG